MTACRNVMARMLLRPLRACHSCELLWDQVSLYSPTKWVAVPRLRIENAMLKPHCQMFETLTPRWALFLMGCIGLLLAPVPFLAFYFGPQIRERSPYSKILMAEEKKRVEAEIKMKMRNDEEIARVLTGQSVPRAVSRGLKTKTSRDRSQRSS